MTATGLDPDTVTALANDATHHHQHGDEAVFVFPDQAGSDKAVDTIRGAGGRVCRLTPERQTLEDYFMQKTSEGVA